MKAERTLVPRVGVGSICSPLEVGADRAPGAAEDLARLLSGNRCEVVSVGAVNTADKARAAGIVFAGGQLDAIALTPTSWFEDYLALEMVEECPLPLLLWPLPGMETGALCGAQQLTCYLRNLEYPYSSVFGPIGGHACLQKAMVFLRAAALKRRLRRARVGIAGVNVNGMTHTTPNQFMLKKIVGPRVVPLDLPQLLEAADKTPEADARELWQTMAARSGACKVPDKEGIDSMRVYAAIKEVASKHGLDAVTVGCYPHLMGRVCLAASLLADDGIPFACEGDVHGAVAQFALQLLTGAPTHNTDWLEPLEDGTVVFTHCGSGSFSLAEKASDITLSSVRLMGQGCCALFPAKPGPVTLLNFSVCPEGYQCALLEGEAVSTTMVFPGNPVRVRFGAPAGMLIDRIHEEGVAHHWMIGYGHVGAEIRAWAGMIGKALRLVAP